MEPTCGSCGHVNDAGAEYCSRCGAALSALRGPVRTDECAGWWQRLGAALIDWALFVVLTTVVVGGYVLAWWSIDPTGLERAWDAIWNDYYVGATWAEFVLIALVPFLLVGALSVAWEVWWLRSRHLAKPGQWLCGFRVVRANDATPLTRGRAWGRLGAKTVLAYGLNGLAVPISAFTIGLTAQKLALHDLIAGTACVRRSALADRGVGPDAATSLARTGPATPAT